MRFSKRCQYGIKATVCLAQHRGNGYLQSRTIADAEGLPGKFLESILLSLRSAEILESKVGAGGGYRLSRPPSEIQVSEMVVALNGGELDEPHAGASTPGNASLAIVNARIDEALDRAFGTMSLEDLMRLADGQTESRKGVRKRRA